jgi:hypothetical protein
MASSSSTDNGNDINKCKLQFYKEISSYTNNSSNNPLFSAERYDQMIELIINAKLKTPGNRSTQEISCLKKAHATIGHRGIVNTLKEVKKKFVNITEKQVTLMYHINL